MNSTDFFKKAKTHLERNQAFVLYRKPGDPHSHRVTLNAFFQNNRNAYRVVDFKESGFVMAPFDLEEKAYLLPLKDSERIKAGYRQNEFPIGETHQITQSTSKAHAFHLKLVEKGIQAITANKLEKVVLSRTHTAHTVKDPFSIFQGLLKLYPTAFVYCWFHPKEGFWLGATPEILLNVQQNRLKTVSLAGTKSALENPEPQWTSKEIEEQQLVTRFIENTLKNQVKNLKTSPLESVRAGNLWHLKNTVSAQLTTPDDLGNIIRAIHPTPAVCGLPKLAAKEFILKNEDYSRQFYAGFLGELNTDESCDLFVNLRCMKMKDEACDLFVGGGIVTGSNPESEWQETLNKAGTILRAL